MPTEASEKIEAAQSALAKVSKQAVAMLTEMKKHVSNDLVRNNHAKLGDYLSQVNGLASKLEHVLILGTDEYGKKATCESELKVLAASAGLLEQTFHHLRLARA